MKAFSELFEALDSTTSTQAKVDAIARYLSAADPADAAWALYFLMGNRFKRVMPVRLLAQWASELRAIPDWLFSECYGAVGDLAEIVALLMEDARYEVPDEPPLASSDPRVVRDLFADPRPIARSASLKTLAEYATAIQELRGLPQEIQRARVLRAWSGLGRTGIYLVTKMLTGELRVGASSLLVIRALAQATGVETTTLTHRLMGEWSPSAEAYSRIVGSTGEGDVSRPYPFMLASPLELGAGGEPDALGERSTWLVDWKWDGLRCQLVRREGRVWLWSRGEELITSRFPEIARVALKLPDGTVLDGEILAFRDERPLPFAVLQKRIGRKDVSAKTMRDAPVVYIAFDSIEDEGVDSRSSSAEARRARLELRINELGDSTIRLSPLIEASSWTELASLRRESRARGVEGLMIKARTSEYETGRKRGGFWKWKIDPHTIDAVLTYAQSGSGKRSNLFTDYTFAVWDGDELVPIAKAYSGLDAKEIDELDRWVRAHTLDRHGPIRAVEPVHVFELAFEGIAESSRHRGGLALRFPRIARWRRDKRPDQADRLESVRALLDVSSSDRSDPAGEIFSESRGKMDVRRPLTEL